MPDDPMIVPDTTADDTNSIPLPQGDNPMSDPTDVPAEGQVDDTHPATDTGVQAEERYDGGLADATGATGPTTPPEPPARTDEDEESPLTTPGE